MKNYKFLVPLVLIVLFGASLYMLYDTKASTLKKYEEHLSAARTFREQDVRVDAEASYKNALNINPSLELYIEIGEFYKETKQSKQAIKWGDTILNAYPKEPQAYEFQIGLFVEQKDFVSCFKLADEFSKRGLNSEIVSDYISKYEYEYFFNGEYLDVGVFSGGMCSVLTGNKWGYIDNVGEKVIDTKFDKVGAFSGGLAPVIDADGDAYYIDSKGNKKFVVLDVENVEEVGFIENGIYSVYNGDTWGFYDQEYNLLYGGYQEVSSIGNGVIAVKKDDKWSLINRDGNDLTGKTYEVVAMDEKLIVYRNDRVFVNDGTGYQMIDSTGTSYGEKFEDVHIFNDTTYAAVKLDGKWGFVNADGEIIIKPQYQDAHSFANGYAAVMKDYVWGFIDMEGRMVIEPQFREAKDFNDHGGVFVIKSDDWELLRLYKNNY